MSFPKIAAGTSSSSSNEDTSPPGSIQEDSEAARATKDSSSKEAKKKKTYQQVTMPSHEQIMQEDFMNNCAIRTGLSGVMGLGLGAMFGVAMGTFDTAVSFKSQVLLIPGQKLLTDSIWRQRPGVLSFLLLASRPCKKD